MTLSELLRNAQRNSGSLTADVSDDWNAGTSDGAYAFGLVHTAFQFYGATAAFFDASNSRA